MQHALYGTPMQNLLWVSHHIIANKSSLTLSISVDCARFVIHEDDKPLQNLLFFVPNYWWIRTEVGKCHCSFRINIPHLPCCTLTFSTESRDNITSSTRVEESDSFRFVRANIVSSVMYWYPSEVRSLTKGKP